MTSRRGGNRPPSLGDRSSGTFSGTADVVQFVGRCPVQLGSISDTPAEGDVGNLRKASRLRWRARFAVGEGRGRCRAGEVDHVNNGGHILIISVCYEPDVLVQSAITL